MLSEPYNFTKEDLENNKNDIDDNEHEYEEGGLCKLEVNDKIIYDFNMEGYNNNNYFKLN